MTATADKLVIGVADVATLLNRTTRSIEHAIQRGSDWLPEPFKMGHRWCWLRSDVESHVERMADGITGSRRAGRPRNRR